MKYAKYSLGKMALSLVRNKKPEIFLKSGDYEYKRHYGSIEEFAYSEVIYRHVWQNMLHSATDILKECVKKLLPAETVNAVKKLLGR